MISDSLLGLAREFDAMPRAAQRAIRARLSPAERDALERQAGMAAPLSAAAGLDDLSPWLARHVAAAADEATDRSGVDGVTAATRELLRRAASAPADAAQHIDRAMPQTSGRSLFDAVGGLLGQRRGRP